MKINIYCSGDGISCFPVEVTEEEAKIVHRVLNDFCQQVRKNNDKYAPICEVVGHPPLPNVKIADTQERKSDYRNRKPRKKEKTSMEIAMEKAGITKG